MWKLLFLVVAFSVSLSPADARQPPGKNERVEKRDSGQRAGELRRDVERISKEIYPPRRDRRR
jgi:hypothetical protein